MEVRIFIYFKKKCPSGEGEASDSIELIKTVNNLHERARVTTYPQRGKSFRLETMTTVAIRLHLNSGVLEPSGSAAHI